MFINYNQLARIASGVLIAFVLLECSGAIMVFPKPLGANHP